MKLLLEKGHVPWGQGSPESVAWGHNAIVVFGEECEARGPTVVPAHLDLASIKLFHPRELDPCNPVHITLLLTSHQGP